ncbi:hypothetical protein [Nitrospira moscoviensis]|uniref:Uncharacterized protein n=1 Tax=Nitrospira moscoviensis TaxID=42253 RepID=A0A0K2G7H3_NITMO|nr:hypothetical protein [Nitrospira moscoviensis]ALA56824.1 hypothetical protein NITMOv2_0388 [Nitrospira moscoviensis]
MGTGDRDSLSRSEPPLWSIGLAVVVILLAPLVLYSLAPSGPLREGDTIFSEGQQRVLLRTASGASSLQEGEICLLDPGNPLIIIGTPGDQPDEAILAQVQGNPAIEWPFCPPHAEVLLKAHQIYQKPDVLKQAQELLTYLLGR